MSEEKIKVLKVSVEGVGFLYMDKATHDFIDLVVNQVKGLKKENKKLQKQLDNVIKALNKK